LLPPNRSTPGNQLESLPESIGNLTALEDLALSGNRLAALPAGATALPKLRRLAVNGNRLTAVPEEWGVCKELQELHLQGNRLTAVPDGLTHLPVSGYKGSGDQILILLTVVTAQTSRLGAH
jgi:Leucine-rich repeat (LRR) protein